MRIHPILVRFALFSVLAVLVLNACAPAQTQIKASSATNTPPFSHTACAKGIDLENQTITFDHIIDPGDQTDTVYNPLRAGFADAAEYFNAHGGICGAAVAHDFDEKNWADAETSYQHFLAKNPKPVVMMLYGSGAGVEFGPELAKEQIPGLNLRGGSTGSVYGEDGKTLGWAFDLNPLYPDQVGAMCDYIAANPQRFPKPVLGFLDAGDSWAGEATAAGRPYCQSKGIGDAGVMMLSDGNLNSQVEKLVNSGATIIYSSSHEDNPARIAKTLLAMGLRGKVTLAVVNRGFDAYSALFSEADLDPEGFPAIDGAIGSLPVRSLAETNHPGIQLINAQADLHKRSVSLRTDGYILAWAATDLLIETYIQTGNRVGFDHVTGAEFKKTLENIVYAPLGGVEQVDFQKGQRRALAANRIGVMHYLGQDGKKPAGRGNPPMMVKEGGRQVMVPMILPLTDFQPAPDLNAAALASAHPAVAQTATAPVAAAEIPVPTSGPAPMGKVSGRIAFTTNRDGNYEIYVMNGDGTDLTNLTNNKADDTSPVWSPDGQKIAFVTNRDGNGEVYLMNADGTHLTNLSNNPADDGSMTLDWSPDGKTIIFGSDRDGNLEIYSMNADGSSQVNLTKAPDTNEMFGRFSADGKQIGFIHDDVDSEILLMNSDGSNTVPLTKQGKENVDTAWSPDGKAIAYVHGQSDGDYEIYLMNADGSSPIALTNSPGHVNNMDPRWSPDGKQIIFWSDRDGNAELYAMNADGSSQIRLTDSPGDDVSPMWQP